MILNIIYHAYAYINECSLKLFNWIIVTETLQIIRKITFFSLKPLPISLKETFRVPNQNLGTDTPFPEIPHPYPTYLVQFRTNNCDMVPCSAHFVEST